jgi:hypothetical protein
LQEVARPKDARSGRTDDRAQSGRSPNVVGLHFVEPPSVQTASNRCSTTDNATSANPGLPTKDIHGTSPNKPTHGESIKQLLAHDT